MMRIAMVVAALALVACARDQAGTTADTSAPPAVAPAPVVPTEVQTAVEVERGIQAAPNKADSVLSAHGLTQAGFDSLMYRIAGDSGLRAAFASARP